VTVVHLEEPGLDISEAWELCVAATLGAAFLRGCRADFKFWCLVELVFFLAVLALEVDIAIGVKTYEPL
jgi:hypothetical protein